MLCVISVKGDEKGWHDLQSNSAWFKNPYGESFAIVPDEMVPAIKETLGYCDIELNEDGTEVVSFIAREIPVIPERIPEPTNDELVWQAITDIEIEQMEQAQAITDLEIAQLEGSAE